VWRENFPKPENVNMDVNELIHRWREDTLSEEQLRRLTDALASKEARAALRAEWLLDAGLAEALRAATVAELRETDALQEMEPMPSPQASHRHVWRSWLPLAAAACVALLVSGWLVSHFHSSRPRRDVSSAFASSQDAIARFSYEPPATLPEWLSPTASILDQPRFPQ
jgi:anti-sigma factor RsiW